MQSYTLIADSGSTKTDWLLSTSSEAISFSTSGYNPYILGMEALIHKLAAELMPHIQDMPVHKIRFYGSGFSSDSYISALQDWFALHLGTQDVQVAHDMLGTARACCGHAAGIAAILGTGSNSCLFDGKQIQRTLGGHGFLFGDEGSGVDLGKRMVKAMLEQTISPRVSQLILEDTQCKTVLELRNKIYRAEKMNTALAALSQWMLPKIHFPEIEQLVVDSFSDFIERTILKYADSQYLPVHFTGSIALHYNAILIRTLQKYSIQPGNCIGRPVDALVLYHESER